MNHWSRNSWFCNSLMSLCNENPLPILNRIVYHHFRVTPIGVCFMIAGSVMKVDDVGVAFQGLGMFIVTVTAGLGICFFMTIFLYFLVTFKNPFKFLRHCVNAWFISFATTSPYALYDILFANENIYIRFMFTAKLS